MRIPKHESIATLISFFIGQGNHGCSISYGPQNECTVARYHEEINAEQVGRRWESI
jgi:hypothetical protein